MAIDGKISGDPLATDATGVVMAGVQGGVNKGIPATLFQPAGNYQPLDADLTAIAGQGTSSYGRPLVAQADAAAARAYLGIVGGGAPEVTLSGLAVTMWSGGTVNIECFGDSTMFGYDPSIGDGSTPYPDPDPAPQWMQLFLRFYYRNNNITVTNRAKSGSRSTQMLDGTDGSGSTFEAKMAISPADIIYCNHNLNDFQLAVATDPAVYRENLISYVNICWKYNKVPIIVTGNPLYAFSANGLATSNHANIQKAYIKIQHDVSEEMNVVLIDIYDMVDSYLRSGDYKVQDVLPDGVHPYKTILHANGQYMACPLVHPHEGLKRADQFISAGEGTVSVSPYIEPLAAVNSRTGTFLQATTSLFAKDIMVAVRVDQPGLDLWAGVPIYPSGASNVQVKWDLDGVLGPISETGPNLGSEFIQDQEFLVARNIPVGLHSFQLQSVGAISPATIALNYLRSRPTVTKKSFTKGTISPTIWRTPAIPRMQMSSSGTDVCMIREELPFNRFNSGLVQVQFDGSFSKLAAFVVHGAYSGQLGVAGLLARMGIGVGLDASGFASVFQLTGDNTYTTSTLGGADLSGATHTYLIQIAQGLGAALQVFVDGSSVGSVGALTAPYLGGFMGLWSSGASKIASISNLAISS